MTTINAAASSGGVTGTIGQTGSASSRSATPRSSVRATGVFTRYQASVKRNAWRPGWLLTRRTMAVKLFEASGCCVISTVPCPSTPSRRTTVSRAGRNPVTRKC